jgi:hypothetical protein
VAVVIGVLVNDSDVDGDLLNLTSVSDPPHGSAVVNPDGTIAYTPDADYYGSDDFTYTIGDGNVGTDTATVNVSVNSCDE